MEGRREREGEGLALKSYTSARKKSSVFLVVTLNPRNDGRDRSLEGRHDDIPRDAPPRDAHQVARRLLGGCGSTLLGR